MKLHPALRDFRNLVHEIWDALGLPEPTPIQYEVAEYMQNGPPRRMVLGFRGMAKTYLAVAYAMARHRWEIEEKGKSNLRVLFVSQGKEFADSVSTFAFQLMGLVPEFQCLQPLPGQRCSTIKFDVGPSVPSKDPSVKSLGIFGQLTGSRADLIIADDVETPNTAGTVGQRDKLRKRVAELSDVITPGGEIIILGTPQDEDTIYNLLEERGYQKRIWPARYPGAKLRERLGEGLAPGILERLAEDPTLEGRPTDPQRFDHDELLLREAEEGRSRFQQQFMLDPSGLDSEARPLKLLDLIVDDLDPEVAPEKIVWASSKELTWQDLPIPMSGDRFVQPMFRGPMKDYTGCVMAVDPSGRGSDETAWCVAKTLNGTVFIPEFGGALAGFEDSTLEHLARIAARFKVNELLIESNFGQGMFAALLMPHLRKVGHHCTITEVRSSGQKERRICDTLEPLLGQHRLVIDAGCLRREAEPREGIGDERALQYRLSYQLSRITRKRGSLAHDDRVDVLAMACSYWAQAVSRNNEEALKAQEEEAFLAYIDTWPGGGISRNIMDNYMPRNMRRTKL